MIALLSSSTALAAAVVLAAAALQAADLGSTANTVAAGNDARLVAAAQGVASIAALRALPAPVTGVNSGLALVQGYYAPNDGGGGQFQWDPNSTLADNGGTVIAPAPQTPGRWLRVSADPTYIDVRTFGAKTVEAGDPIFDSLPAVNAAITSLPNRTYSTVPSPGAGGTGQAKVGTLFFPSKANGDGELGYYFGDTLYLTTEIKLVGSPAGTGTPLRMMPGVAPSADAEKFLVVYLVQGDSNVYGNPGNSFFTAVDQILFDTGGSAVNPGGSGAYIAVANRGVIGNVSVGANALRGIVINSTGCEVHNLWVGGRVERGPGLQFEGGHIVADHLSVEHTNLAFGDFTASTPGYAPKIDPVDGLGDPYPALLIESSDTVIGDVQCEASALCVKVRNALGCRIGSFSSNACAAGIKLVGDTNDFSVGHTDSTDAASVVSAYAVRDVSSSGGQTRNVTLGQRRPYTQNSYVDTASVNTLTVNRSLTITGMPVVPESLSTSSATNRLRVVGTFQILDQLYFNSSAYLVRLQDNNGNEASCIFSLAKGHEANATYHLQPVSGAGMFVQVTGLSRPGEQDLLPTDSAYRLQVEADFSLVEPAFGGQMWVTVTPLGQVNLSDGRGRIIWTAGPEIQATVLDGTAVPTLSVPAAPVVQVYTEASSDPTIKAGTTRFVYQATPGGSYSVALPPAASYLPGTPLTVVDAQGYTSNAAKVTYVAGMNSATNVTDTLSGTAALSGPAVLTFYSDGVSAWVVH